MTNVLEAIGNTPLVELRKAFNRPDVTFYGKLESLNPGGSIKDRTARSILMDAFRKGELKPGDTIIESSSGNMAIGLAQASLYLGLKLIVVVDPNINPQNVKILEAYNAKIDIVKHPALVGGYLSARINRVHELLEEIPNSYWTNQYGNRENPNAHRQTMQEVVEALPEAPDYIFIATSTCGTLMGCAEYCEANSPRTKVVAVDAEGSVLFGTPAKKRLIPGHGAGRPSQFLKVEKIHDVIHVNDADCVNGCYHLLNNEALFCGGSSGAIVSAVRKYLPKIEEGSTCVLILCDRGERYLDTIYNQNWVAEHLEMNPPLTKRIAI